tara:strand:+ start:774 stop:3533 length:2760 start_codon:yes stop_codon:yes gene_type:complete
MLIQSGFSQGVTISPWKMNKGGGAISFSLNNHGNPAAYTQANIPGASDPNWVAAPVNASGEINYSVNSILTKCLQQLDFTYFETYINIPTNYNVSSLNVAFTAADDGARAYIFNSSHPNGAFIGEISLGGSPTSQNYASLSVAGEINRLVIVQFDDCPSGNNLTGAKVKVNGNVVAINTGGCTTSNFFWSDAPTVSGKTATGTINGIGYTYSSDVSFTTTSNLFGHNKFPSQYNIPNQISIRNDYASNNTLKFNKPMTNPVLVFASIGGGQPSPTVSIQFQDNFSVVWAESGTTTVDLNAKKVTGTEGNIIIRFDGTFTELNFSYLNAESWVNFAFGADFSTTSPDTIAPTITLNGSTAQSINAFTTYTDPGATITDNCDTNPAILGSGTVNTNVPGTYTLTYTGVDASGNTSPPLTRVVTVVNPVPTAICKPITVYLDASGKAIITPQQVDNGSNSSVGISNMSLSKTAFDCTNVGVNTVTLAVTSSLGATATCNAIVTVVDNTPPTVITQPLSVSLDASGNASITAAQINNNSTDNCTIESMTLDISSFTCDNTGDNTVTLTVTDASGNTASQTAVVTVTDAIAPTVITKDFTIALANGIANITSDDINNGTFDNCDFTLSIDKNTFTCDDIGDHTVTLTATDASGNTSSNTAKVTIEGAIPEITISDFTAVQSQKTNTIFLGYGPESINLSTSTTGGSSFTYVWSASTGEYVSNVANPVVSPMTSTTYTVTATNNYGCSATTTIDVCVMDVRSYDKKAKATNKVVVCHHTSGKKGTKHVIISISKNAVMQHLTLHGAYTSHGDRLGDCNATCISSNPIVAAPIANNSEVSLNNLELQVYPNPSNGVFQIKIVNIKAGTEFNLFDVTGKLVSRKIITTDALSKSVTVGNKNLPSGIYILKIISTEEIITKKLIINQN